RRSRGLAEGQAEPYAGHRTNQRLVQVLDRLDEVALPQDQVELLGLLEWYDLQFHGSSSRAALATRVRQVRLTQCHSGRSHRVAMWCWPGLVSARPTDRSAPRHGPVPLPAATHRRPCLFVCVCGRQRPGMVEYAQATAGRASPAATNHLTEANYARRTNHARGCGLARRQGLCAGARLP